MISVNIEIKPQTIAHLFCSAIEGGDPVTSAHKGGWCAGIEPVDYSKRFAEKLEKEGKPYWYAEPEFWQHGFEIEILEVEDESKEWDAVTRHNLTVHRLRATHLRAAFEVMATKFAHQFSEVVTGNHDAGTADILLQLMCFGEEKYA